MYIQNVYFIHLLLCCLSLPVLGGTLMAVALQWITRRTLVTCLLCSLLQQAFDEFLDEFLHLGKWICCNSCNEAGQLGALGLLRIIHNIPNICNKQNIYIDKYCQPLTKTLTFPQRASIVKKKKEIWATRYTDLSSTGENL